MNDKLLFENNFVEEESKYNAEVALLEDEPSHGSDSNTDIAQLTRKTGFAKATLSRTLPAMVGYVQPVNGPTGYVFGFRPKGNAGTTDGTGSHATNSNDPDNIEYQGTNGEVGAGETSPGATTISVINPITNNTAEDFMITRKSITTNLREVKVDITNEVEQDVQALFGDNYAAMYYEFMDPTTDGAISKVASFFFEYATTQMVKKTNTAFTSYLDSVATPLGTAASIDSTDKLIFALAEMQGKLYGPERKKVAGRTWVICAPDVAAAIANTGSTFGGWDDKSDRELRSYENSFVATIGNMDVYSSADIASGGVFMGIIGNANISSIYYTPYNEYMIAGSADPYTGISNIFFRVRDDWVTNPLDTFNKTQPTTSAGGTPEYPALDVTEGTNSDYIVKGILTIPTSFA